MLALVLLAQLPSYPRIWNVLNNAAHAPVFAALSLIAFQVFRRGRSMAFRSALVWAFGATIVLGIGVELIQGLIGRDSSWSDVRADTLGAACALGWIAYRNRTGSRTLRLAGLSTAVLAGGLALHPVGEALAAYGLRTARFPTIATFASSLDLYFAELHGVSAERVTLPTRWARHADPLSLRLSIQHGEWPGFAITEPAPDWRGYETLHIDVTNPGTEPFQAVLRVHDQQHNQQLEDRFNRQLSVAAETRTNISIPLADVEAGPSQRPLELGHVAGLILFTTGVSARPDTEIYLTRIWLE